MNLPIATVVAFAVWTLCVLIAGVGIRRWYLILTGQTALNSFPADTPHGTAAYRRAMRAHANCVENLPVYAALVFACQLTQTMPAGGNLWAPAFMAARIGQSLIHMALPESNLTVGLRFPLFLVQLIIMGWIAAALVPGILSL